MGTKLERKDVKVFASNPNHATQVSAFLTGKNETPDYTSDPNAIQNAYYPKGWFGAGENDLPQGTDMNGVMYAESYKNAYLYEMGIAEWSSTQEYFENSYCQVNGVLYLSLIDENLNNNPTTDNGTKWKEIVLEPYTGENVGTGEGVFKQKTIDNKLQFKTIAVTGNGNISSSGDVVTIAIGGGGTGDVYWGAIDGTLSNQSDLQQALNLKQNLIGYTPEDASNKVTTVRTDTVATDTAYPSEKATRTAIDNAITSANNYTDTALQSLSTDAFVLYANSWTDIYTGTLTTTTPTGTGTNYSLTSISTSTYENIANFSYTTVQETTFNNTFTYDILVPIRNANIQSWLFKFILTITHSDVNSGQPTTLINYESNNLYTTNGSLNIEIKQDLLNVNSINYPIGSTINFQIMAKSSGEGTTPYNFDLLVYDQTNPLVISRNKGINKNLVTAFYTQELGTLQNQEYFNSYINRNKQPNINGVTITETSTTFDVVPKSSITTSNIGSSSYPFSSSYIDNIKTDEIAPKTTVTPDPNNPAITNKSVVINNFEIKEVIASDTNDTGVDISSTLPINANTIATLGFYRKFNSINVDTLQANSGINTASIAPTIGNTSINVSGSMLPSGTVNLGSTGSEYYEGWIQYIKTNQILAIAGGPSLNLSYNDISPSTAGYQAGYAQAFYSIHSSNFDQNSDVRDKRNIKSYEEDILDKLDKLTPITYNYLDNKERTLGLSAQELKEIEPLIVTSKVSNTKDGESEERLEINLYGLIVLNMKAIKELKTKVETLEARVNELEGNKKELEK